MGVIPSLILMFAIAGALIYLSTIYNGLVALRNDMDKAWANIDVLLKQRHDELHDERGIGHHRPPRHRPCAARSRWHRGGPPARSWWVRYRWAAVRRSACSR